MTPGARLAGVIEVLDAIRTSTAPADEVLKAWGRARRFAGSKDRRAIGEQVYTILRARTRLSWMAGAEGGRDLVLAALIEEGRDIAAVEALFNGEGYAPAPLSAEERARLLAPHTQAADWIAAGVPPFAVPMLQARFAEDWLAEAIALTGSRAPLDLRVNHLRGEVEQALSLLKTDGLEPSRTPLSAIGLRLPAELAPDVTRLRAFSAGWVEVQDEASQVASALAGAAPGRTVVDYCAGGGGKMLALAAAMGSGSHPSPGTRLVACDVNARRLAAIQPRMERAGALAEVRQLGPGGEGVHDLERAADLVFVDAPCSGSGTWRRHPEGTWRVTGEVVERLAVQQLGILERASALVRPGGRLAYATCSVLGAENDAVAAAFEIAHPQFRPVAIAEAARASPDLTEYARTRLPELAGAGSMLQLTPHRAGTDGFFLALFERIA